ncbi:MPN527 family putative ECF transporter permease subunit [Mycoplasma bradburyae]|uniref:MPN527 family putative ECF transporter permease subunit n=1 Tax=Mycoplasma bradburyae TaxID=2963128 RepID=UPI003A929433
MLIQKKDKKKNNNYSFNFKLSFNASMLALAIIFAYFSSLIKIPFFSSLSLTIDISIVFLLPVIYISSLISALMLSLTLSLVHFIWNPSNWIGIIFLTIINVFVILIFCFLNWLFNKTNLKNKKIKWLIIWILIIPISMVLFSAINGILITPLYWWWFRAVKTINFIEIANYYNSTNNLRFFLLFIDDYWTGIFALYSFFNFAKFSLIAFFAIPLLIFFQHNLFTKNLF